jgi:RNA-directed DNA polymerase
MEVLPKMFAKQELTLHPKKTKLIDMNSKRSESNRSTDFLGFTHYLGKNRKRVIVLKHKTSSKRLSRANTNISNYIKSNRYLKLKNLIVAINIKLHLHYSYYGITFNTVSIVLFFLHVRRCLFKLLNRRGRKRKWYWNNFSFLVEQYHNLVKPLIYYSYESTK